MFCKNCGAQLLENSKFCSNCGAKVEEAFEYVAVEDESTESIDEATQTPDGRIKTTYQKIADKLFIGAFASAGFGVILFLGIVLVSLIGWGEVYLYGGYDFTAVLTTISLIFMLLGFVVLTAVFAINLKLKSIKLLTKNVCAILSIVLIFSCAGLSIWGFVDCANENDNNNSYNGGSYGGAYNNYYDSGVDKSIGLSLKVDNIKNSGNYTYVYCTVTNISARYVATKYRFVKVKAQFKNSYGKIVDTDWTYAVDSTWLDPGESKTFYFMVQNTDIESATLSFVD